MDYSEQTVLELLKKRPVVSKREIFSTLKNLNEDDVNEAILSLQNQGYLTIVEVMGEDTYSITKKGLRMLE